MFENMSYDELNNQNTTIKSMPIDRYFSDMKISDEDKAERIELAKEFEEQFRYVLILLFTMMQYGGPETIDWNYIRIQFQMVYRQSLDNVGIPVDSYLDLAMRDFADEVTQSTIDNVDDPYYYTEDRATFMAEDQSAGVGDYRDYQKAVQSGKTMKTWVDMRDNRERKTHLAVGGTTIPINNLFHVGDSLMRFPKDIEFDASPEERINCRCHAEYK